MGDLWSNTQLWITRRLRRLRRGVTTRWQPGTAVSTRSVVVRPQQHIGIEAAVVARVAGGADLVDH